MSGSIYHLFTSPVPDGSATSVVRPSDWNSVHQYSGLPDGISVAGTNTAGVLTVISSGTLYLAGGPNVTLSQNANSISISAGSAAAAPVNFSAGAASGNLGSVVFSNSGGVSFGLNASTITATVATNYQSQGAYLTTAMQSNAATISNINISGGTTSSNVSAVTFSNANGVSFGYDGTNISATVATNYQSQGAYLTTAALSQNTSNYAGINSAITGGSMTVNTSGVSINLPAYLTTADLSANSSNYIRNWKLTGNTAGTTSSAQGTDFWLAGGNGVTVSGSSNTISLSVATNYQSQGAYLTTAMQSNAATISNVNVSAGGSSANVSAITFSNVNGVTFGYDKTNITASVAAQSNQAGSVYASSNTFGTSSGTYDARSLSIAGSGAVNVAASNSGWVISAPTQTVQTQNCVDVTLAGNSTSAGAGYILISSGTMVLAGGNNITLSQNGQSVTVSAANAPGQTNQAGSVYASSNTFGTSSGTYDARTLSIAGSGAISVAASNSGWVISAPVQTNQTLSLAATSNTAGNTSGMSVDARSLTIAGYGAASVGYSTSAGGSTVVVSVPAVVMQTNQTLSAIVSSNTVGNTSGMTFDARSVSFQGYGAASVGLSTTNTGSSILVSVPVQTAQTQSVIQAVYDGANSISTGTIRFTNANGVSFSINGQTLSASVAAQTNQTLSLAATSNTAGNTSGMSVDARSLTFAGYGIASVGYSTSAGGSTVVVSASQTVQTQNCVDVTLAGNSTSAGAGYILISSGTLVLAGGNNVTLSQNGQSVTVSAGQAAAGIASVAASGGTQTTGMVSFINSNGVTFGMSTGAATGTVTASVAAQSNQTISLAATSNTAGNTSGMSVDARSITFAGYGAVSVGYSTSAGGSTVVVSANTQTNQSMGFYATGNTTSSATSTTYDARSVSFSGAGAISVGMSGASGIVVSSPVTSSLSATGWASVATNASTISIGATYTGNVYAVGNTFGTSSGTADPRTLSISGVSGIQVAGSNSGWAIGNVPLSVYEPFPILTGTSYSSHAPASWWFNRVVLPDVLAVSNINVAKSLSVAVFVPALASSGTQKYSYSHGVTVYTRQDYAANSSNLTTYTTASFGMTGSLSVTVSSVSAALSWVTNSTGGTTSQSTTFNGASFGSWSVYFSGPFVLGIPCVTTLAAGEYFFAHAHSSTAATGGGAIFALSTNLLSVSNLHVAPQVVGPLQTLGQSITQASLNPWGMGAGIASAVTTNNSMAGSIVSGQTQNNIYMALQNF